VPTRYGQQRVEGLRAWRPCARELPGQLAVLGLEDYLPQISCVANEQCDLSDSGLLNEQRC
jgi:hypothetical protein